MRNKVALAVGILSLAGCDSLTGPGRGGNVAIRFSTTSSSALSSNLVSAGNASPHADQLTVTGTNGTIVIDDIRFIVENMKLRSSDANSACDDDEDENEIDDDRLVSTSQSRDGNEDENDEDECEFKGGPFIVDLPLQGNTTIATQDVPAGTYDRVKFRIDDLEADDDDDDGEKANTPNLLSDMRAVYPNFPSRASMVVKGTQNGQPFVVYFRSKLNITQPISPPLVVPGSQTLTVQIDPSMWFKNGNQVVNLLALNGQLVDFGNGFSGGIRGAHRDDD